MIEFLAGKNLLLTAGRNSTYAGRLMKGWWKEFCILLSFLYSFGILFTIHLWILYLFYIIISEIFLSGAQDASAAEIEREETGAAEASRAGKRILTPPKISLAVEKDCYREPRKSYKEFSFIIFSGWAERWKGKRKRPPLRSNRPTLRILHLLSSSLLSSG